MQHAIPAHADRATGDLVMQALVLIAHGSRRKTSNQEVQELALRLRHAATERYPLVTAGFLELASPSIPEAIEFSIASGATSVVIVPYFLAAGRHVVEDIPGIVEPVAKQHPDIPIEIAEHIGMSDAMIQVILESARKPATKTVTHSPHQSA